MMASAKEIIVLADHTKFGNIAMMRVAPIERVRRIITGSGTSGEVVAACEEQGVEVEVVSTEGAGRTWTGPSARSGRP
jgi:DeoR/GlpR family transcriptional regulator of sugar metabolism